jgi:parallel beta-helix repeat protein
MMSNYNTIERNNVSENTYYGIFIGGRNNTIRYNTANNNGWYGIHMGRSDGSYNNELYENTACGNVYTDIRTCGPECYGNHGDNNTCNTTSYYNDDGTTGCAYDCGYTEVGCVAEDGTVFRCGDTATKSCTLNGNMTCLSGPGLVIGADNITINGNGYAIDGVSPGACDSIGIERSGIYNKAHDDITIKNLEIKNFCSGIYFRYDGESGDKVERITIENCEIHHNGAVGGGDITTQGIKWIGVFDSTIKSNRIHDNTGAGDACTSGGNGIFINGISGKGAWNNTIIENDIYNNTKGGFLTRMMCRDTSITHNNIYGNGQGGIILRCKLSNSHLIEHNNASDNYGSGIFIGGNDNTIIHNTVCNNGDGGHYTGAVGGHGYGIHIGRSDGSLNNTLISNTVCGNDYLDIRVVTGVTGTTGDDNTCNTTLNYDDTGTTGCTYFCGTQEPKPKGDLNGDGVITPADAAIALQMAVRGEYSEDADVSRDHRVTSLDALMILQAAAGLQNFFQVTLIYLGFSDLT